MSNGKMFPNEVGLTITRYENQNVLSAID